MIKDKDSGRLKALSPKDASGYRLPIFHSCLYFRMLYVCDGGLWKLKLISQRRLGIIYNQNL